MTFGERLRLLRKNSGFTNKQLADQLEISPRMVTFLETDEREPNIGTLVLLSSVLNTSIDYLLKGDGSKVVETFGTRIKKLRTNQKWTQEQLADQIGIDRVTLTHYESLYREPNFEKLIKLARVFNVTTDYLLGYEVEK